jgi:signal transduction histidine kinase
MNQLIRKITVAFCLISIIPLLVFAYLVLPRLLPTARYIAFIPIIALITAIIVVLGLLLLINISREITKLSTSADIISKGDLTHNVQVKGSDEVVELSGSLNQITHRLRENMNDLETRAILIERTNKELDRLNKLKSEFVSMVSHELRAPLINIKQTASLLLDTPGEEINPEQERGLMIVHRSAERLLKLIRDLLDISKIEAGELRLNRQMINIGKVIQEAVESLGRWREVKRIGLKLEIEPILPDIYGDPDRINQVLVNLLSNAIKFTPAGGEIVIKADMKKKEHSLEISVEDTGRGIPPEQLDKIFDRFNQAGGRSAAHMLGTGLGLSITKEIVRMHGGKVRVESKQGQGSKFTFTLPISKAEERLRKNIMIIDDEPVVVVTLKKLLKKLGYNNLTGVYDGIEALQKLKTLIPDLLILDMRMPRMSGYEVIGRLKQDANTKNIPILIISGYNVEVDRLKEYTKESPIPMVSKPVNIEQFNRLVNYLL